MRTSCGHSKHTPLAVPSMLLEITNQDDAQLFTVLEDNMVALMLSVRTITKWFTLSTQPKHEEVSHTEQMSTCMKQQHVHIFLKPRRCSHDGACTNFFTLCGMKSTQRSDFTINLGSPVKSIAWTEPEVSKMNTYLPLCIHPYSAATTSFVQKSTKMPKVVMNLASR